MVYDGVELYEKDGKIGVLVSYGYGAGWSTWNDRRLAYDKRVIEWWLKRNHERPVTKEEEKLFRDLGYRETYFGGLNGLELEFVEKGVPFRIREYDGAESIETFNVKRWMVF